MPLVRCVSSIVPDCSLTWQRVFSQTRNAAGNISAEDDTYSSSQSGNGLPDPLQGNLLDTHYRLSPYSLTQAYVPVYTEVGNVVTLAVPAPPSGYTSADITDIRWLLTGNVAWTGSILSASNIQAGYSATGYHSLAGFDPSMNGYGPSAAGSDGYVHPSGENPLTSLKYVTQGWRLATSGADVMGDGYEYWVYRTKHKFVDFLYNLDFAAPDTNVFRPVSQQAPTSGASSRHGIGGSFGAWLISVLGSTVNLRYGIRILPALGCLLLDQTPGVAISYSGTIQLLAQCTGFFLTLDIVYGGDDTPVSTGLTNPWNLQDSLGRYHRVGVKDGIQYQRSDFAVPKPGWAVTSNVTATGTDSHPRVIVDPANRTRVVFERGGNIKESVSDDDGTTWSAPTTMITGGTYPTIAVGQDGAIIRAAYVSGVIQGTYQAAGDTSQSAVFTFKDNAGVDIAVSNGTFHIQQGYEGPARWLLTVVLDGETDTSDWWSGDECRTWTKIT